MSTRITIVTVCYNAEKEIERTVLSIIGQTYPNIEYIVIDGASTDGTMDVIERYKDRINLVVSEPDCGTYDAMNKGIKYATGRWINFMNAGDYFCDKDVVEQMFNGLDETKCGVLFGNSREYRGDVLYSVKPTPFYLSQKKHYNKGICHQSMFVKTALARHHLFKMEYPVAADFDMAYQLYHQEKAKFVYKNMDVAFYDITGFSNKQVGQAYYEEECIIHPHKKHHKCLLIAKGWIKAFIKNVAILTAGIYPPITLVKFWK